MSLFSVSGRTVTGDNGEGMVSGGGDWRTIRTKRREVGSV